MINITFPQKKITGNGVVRVQLLREEWSAITIRIGKTPYHLQSRIFSLLSLLSSSFLVIILKTKLKTQRVVST